MFERQTAQETLIRGQMAPSPHTARGRWNETRDTGSHARFCLHSPALLITAHSLWQPSLDTCAYFAPKARVHFTITRTAVGGEPSRLAATAGRAASEGSCPASHPQRADHACNGCTAHSSKISPTPSPQLHAEARPPSSYVSIYQALVIAVCF